MEPFVIGIDLGTTLSAAAVYRHGKCEIIPNKQGERLTPSIVYFHPDSLEVSVGSTADDLGIERIDNLLFDIKRIIGRQFEDAYVQEIIKSGNYRFKIVEGYEGRAEIEVLHDGRIVRKSPQEISAEVLKYLKSSASEFLGVEVEEAVISVPAYFGNRQKKATKAAGELAGLKVLKLVTEPVAGAIHYGKDRLKSNSMRLVVDFGGGTLDVSIIKVEGDTFDVQSVEGDTYLGGRDMDQILLEHFKSQLASKFGLTTFDGLLVRRLLKRSEKIKKNLSTSSKTSQNLYTIVGSEHQNFCMTLTREEFEHLATPVFDRVLALIDICIKEAGLAASQVTDVVLVGGTTRIPKIRNMLTSKFNSNQKILLDLNPDEAVALGAGIQAALIKSGFEVLEKYHITEVTPLSLGLHDYGGIMSVVIKKNTRLPFTSAPRMRRTVFNNQKSITLEITEGERKNCKFNNKLGSFVINGLPAGRAGTIKCKVIFSLDEDGILEVDAQEVSTGKKGKLVVTIGEFRLCDYKIKRTLENAEQNKTEDDAFERFVTYKNEIKYVSQCIIYDINKIQATVDRNSVQTKCKDLLKRIKDIDYADIDILEEEFLQFKESIINIVNKVMEVDFSSPIKIYISNKMKKLQLIETRKQESKEKDIMPPN